MRERPAVFKAGRTVRARDVSRFDGSDGHKLEHARSEVRLEVADKLLDWFAYHSGQAAFVAIQSSEEEGADGEVFISNTVTVSPVEFSVAAEA
ncbi:MAG: hypothetical protein ACYSUV_20685 [Planctomycetota bacterium]|jgi:hypothetical protein